MPSYGELAQIITALAAAGAFILSWHNSRRIEKVRIATNSLVVKVEAAAMARGIMEATAAAAAKAETLKQGQEEGRRQAMMEVGHSRLAKDEEKVSVEDERTATAAERVAEATETSASAQERVAAAAEKHKG